MTPTRILYALVQSTFCSCSIGKVVAILILFRLGMLADLRDFQLFKDNGLMCLYEFLRFFMMEVPSLIGNFAMYLSY